MFNQIKMPKLMSQSIFLSIIKYTIVHKLIHVLVYTNIRSCQHIYNECEDELSLMFPLSIYYCSISFSLKCEHYCDEQTLTILMIVFNIKSSQKYFLKIMRLMLGLLRLEDFMFSNNIQGLFNGSL